MRCRSRSRNAARASATRSSSACAAAQGHRHTCDQCRRARGIVAERAATRLLAGERQHERKCLALLPSAAGTASGGGPWAASSAAAAVPRACRAWAGSGPYWAGARRLCGRGGAAVGALAGNENPLASVAQHGGAQRDEQHVVRVLGVLVERGVPEAPQRRRHAEVRPLVKLAVLCAIARDGAALCDTQSHTVSQIHMYTHTSLTTYRDTQGHKSYTYCTVVCRD